ncbi:MAG: glycosyltransferase [Ahrensia sp.]|nr:glycosyltransferase [Ahrensia sp.]
MIDSSSQTLPRVSLIVCTHNPRPHLIEACLSAIGAQTMDHSSFELLIVDNNCNPPLDHERMEALARRPVNLLREKRPGLTYARVCGFNHAQSDIITFADDDNELFPDYLERVVEIADSEPDLGVFGGKCLAKLEKDIGKTMTRFLPMLGVRDEGDESLTGPGKEWGPHEPIGAGIVVRRPVADAYVEFVEQSVGTGQLGRTGSQLLSGEDSLISRLADKLGYLCGYRPQLKLHHFMEARRLSWSYLTKLMKGHGISYVRLARVNGETFEPVSHWPARKQMVKNFLFRTKTKGIDDAFMHLFWDSGFYQEVRQGKNPE